MRVNWLSDPEQGPNPDPDFFLQTDGPFVGSLYQTLKTSHNTTIIQNTPLIDKQMKLLI